MTYVKRYAGGFLDRPAVTTPADSLFLNALETELIRLGGHVTNADIDAAAAIAYTKLVLTGQIVNGDIAAGAAIAKSKLAALGIVDADVSAISLSKLTGYPADATKFARGDGTWVVPPGQEVAYAEKQSQTSITNTGGAPDTVLTASAFTADGTSAYLFTFNSSLVIRGSTYTRVMLYEDGAARGIIGESGTSHAVFGQLRFVPASGSRTYSIRAYVDAGTGFVNGGSGSGNNYTPAFLRVVKI